MFYTLVYMPVKINTDSTAINTVLDRGVAAVYPDRDFLQARLASGERLRLYLGIDPTGPSLHLGHAVALRKLRQLQDLGHEVILLIGDFTAMIGDPTDKAAVRKQLTKAEVLANCRDYKKQASKILRFSGKNPVKLKFNSRWLGKLSFAEVVELASEFTVQQMLERDMFEKRVAEGKPVGLHEFLYPLMQGYDSVAMEVDLEVGGNDQTFNMLAGRDMLKSRGKDKAVITMKLLEDPTGKKMGKTEGNMITLADTPADMYGKVMSWTDGMMLPAFEILTDVDLTEAQQLIVDNPRDAKMQLAREVVTSLQSATAAEQAEKAFVQLFQTGDGPADMPEVELPAGGHNVIELFVVAGLVASKSEGRRLVEQHGLAIDDEVVTDVQQEVTITDGMVLRKGKRHFAKVVCK